MCLIHNWGWPRRRGGKDMQTCLDCGAERESRVKFGPPRYRKTQEGRTAEEVQLRQELEAIRVAHRRGD